MTDYNGWTNKATWNTVLWLFNDYNMYQEIKGYSGQKMTGMQAKAIVTRIMGDTTPDGISTKNANWREVADALTE
jgi:hypothetical protein